jgi:hypothetical protein
MKGKFAIITFLILFATVLTYLSLPQVSTVKEITKEIIINTK